MVRLGLEEDDEEDEEEEVRNVRMQAPGEDEEEYDEEPRRRSSQHVVYSPGGLFASPTDMAVDERERGVLGGRETMGLAAQLGLGAEGTSRARSVASPGKRRSLAENAASSSAGMTMMKKKKWRTPSRVLLESRVVEPPAKVGEANLETARMLERAHRTHFPGREARGLSSHGRDYGLFMGRSFRASVSADGRVARPVVGAQRVSVSAARVAEVPERALAVALNRLQVIAVGDMPFRAHDRRRRALARTAADYAEVYGDCGDRVVARSWELVSALWFAAPPDDDDDDDDDGEKESGANGNLPPPTASLVATEAQSNDRRRRYFATAAGARRSAAGRDARYEAVSAWLAGEAAAGEEDEELDDAAPMAVVYRDVARRLCRRDAAAAAERAIEGQCTRLALAIASRAAPEARGALDGAFDAANAEASDASRALLARALGIAAGRLELEDHILAMSAEEEEEDDRAAGLDWFARLGLHVWYERRGSASLSRGVASFEAAAFDRATARRPLALPNGTEVAREYRLLQLGCRDGSARLAYDDDEADVGDDSSYARALSPFSLPGRLAGDVASSWHLHLLLDALHLNAREENVAIRSRLGDGLVFQLLARGRADWALFVVAASFPDPLVRERLARQILDRRLYARGASTRHNDELVQVLGLPEPWFQAATGLRAGIDGPPVAHAAALIKAQDFNGAHEALLRAAQPARALFFFRAHDHDLTSLRALLEDLDSRLDDDDDWRRGAGLYLDFLRFAEEKKKDSQVDLGAAARRLRDRVDDYEDDRPPTVGASAGTVHVPHLQRAFRQHITTTLATIELDRAPPSEKPALFDDLARSRFLAPQARLALLDDLAVDLLRGGSSSTDDEIAT
ncbi:hypothetical protein CTAYLR_007101 [Chrysophaeum taylorii]|uniref:Nuclear pore complex protein NUP96 C-terminal domain-containing protein n=1 Tax=Chrysophaeum taylorii TaxID=2483200 RepID=A0AAD7UMH9_9STRA|nr:hypothetical protein CTAYLR_007101 [Chrysophaeum taylorii]